MPDGTQPRVRVKVGHFAGREGTLVEPQPGDAPGKLRVRFDTGLAGFFAYGDVEFLPGPARLDPREPEPAGERAPDLTSVLCGVAYWQQQDPMKRRAHISAWSPLEALAREFDAIADETDKRIPQHSRGCAGYDHTYGTISGYRLAAERLRECDRPATMTGLQGHTVEVHVVEGDREPRSIKFATPAPAAEVVRALDHLMSRPPGTRARVTTPEAEAVVAHAERTPAYYGQAEGLD